MLRPKRLLCPTPIGAELTNRRDASNTGQTGRLHPSQGRLSITIACVHSQFRRKSAMSHENSAIFIEALGPQDLSAALKIQKEAYPPFLVEEEAVFVSRMNLGASYCFAAKHRTGLLGYLLAHGWRRQSPPSLGALLVDDAPSEVLFIHDLAVSASSRGLGVGRRLINRAFELAAQDGLRRAELVAVEGAAEYWRGLGFVEGAGSDEFSEKVGMYGSFARWMTRDIPHPS